MARSNTRTVTATDKEFAIIKEAAEKQEKSIAAFYRESALEKAKKVKK